MRRYTIRVRASVALVLLCVAPALVLARSARADDAAALVLIVSQPDTGTTSSFVDLAPYIARDLGESSGQRAVTFAPDAPEVQAAITVGKLTAKDVVAPLSQDAARKVCLAIGATQLVRVSASRVKQGIAAHATLDVHSDTGWKSSFDYNPPEPKPIKGSVLQVIYDHASAIAKGVSNPPSDAGVLPPAPAIPTPATVTNPPAAAPAAPVARGDHAPAATPAAPAPIATTDPSAALAPVLERFREKHDDANIIVALRHAINDRPRDAGLRRLLAEAYRRRAMTAAARDEEVRAVALAPNDASLHRLLADSLLDSGDIEGAIREYQTAVRLNAADAENHVALGDAYWNTSKGDDALKCYADGAKADASSPLPHRRLARSAALRAQFADCLAEMKLVYNLSPPGDRSGYDAEYVNLLQLLDTGLQDALTALQHGRKDFVSAARTREQVFQDASASRKRAQDTLDLLTDLPAATSFEGVQAQYGQAASLAAQAADSFMVYLESQSDPNDQQATLLRLESHRQLESAEDRVKKLTEKKPAS